MKKKLKRWTEEELQIIRDEVANNPENLNDAFKTASAKLRGRSKDAVAYKWYSGLKHQATSVFKLQSNKKSVGNIKNGKKIQGLNIISYDKVETTYHNVTIKVGDKIAKADTLTL
jgi:hypothetical protein